MPTCKHNYKYQGVVYHDTGYKCRGSGAVHRNYFYAYYCTRCLDFRTKRADYADSSYDKLAFEAQPLPRGFNPDSCAHLK